tara:strand:+ start:308 stop:457 length:150 start_codon:yes stop_codon:yes gene_type:complete
MIYTILSLTILGLLVFIVYLKGKLDVAEHNLNNWKDSALKLNSIIRSNQ